MRDNSHLSHHHRSQGKRVPQDIRGFAVDLSRDNAGTVSYGLLQTDGEGTAVLRCDVDVQPGHVQSGTGVCRDGAKVGAEVFDGVAGGGEEDDVACYTEEVASDEELHIQSLAGIEQRRRRNIRLHIWNTDPQNKP